MMMMIIDLLAENNVERSDLARVASDRFAGGRLTKRRDRCAWRPYHEGFGASGRVSCGLANNPGTVRLDGVIEAGLCSRKIGSSKSRYQESSR